MDRKEAACWHEMVCWHHRLQMADVTPVEKQKSKATVCCVHLELKCVGEIMLCHTQLATTHRVWDGWPPGQTMGCRLDLNSHSLRGWYGNGALSIWRQQRTHLRGAERERDCTTATWDGQPQVLCDHLSGAPLWTNELMTECPSSMDESFRNHLGWMGAPNFCLLFGLRQIKYPVSTCRAKI